MSLIEELPVIGPPFTAPKPNPSMIEPVRAFRFLVYAGADEGGTTDIVAAFTRFSGIRMQVETIQNRFCDDIRGVRDYYPVFTQYEPVTLSKGVVGNNAFMNWILSASAGSNMGPTGKRLKRKLEVQALNEYGKPVVIWELKNAMPVGYELSPMDSTRSEVLIETVTFAINGVERRLG